MTGVEPVQTPYSYCMWVGCISSARDARAETVSEAGEEEDGDDDERRRRGDEEMRGEETRQ
eukprot:767778-Hanusia_phi.AAC.13